MKKRSTRKLRTDAKKLFLAGIDAVDAGRITTCRVSLDNEFLTVCDFLGHEEHYDLEKYRRIFVAGFGKAVCPMAQSLTDILQHRIDNGIVITAHSSSTVFERIEVVGAGHPIPDENGLHGTNRMVNMLTETNEGDLVIALISGGGSALCTMPAPGIALNDIQKLTLVMLGSGADIREVNVVRKHLSQVKGGQLARFAYPSTMVSLIISDVIGDRLDTIASGPTAPDPSTFTEAHNVLQKYDLLQHTTPAIRNRIEAGCRGQIPETPKPGDRVFARVRNIVMANNLTALRAIAYHAREIGYTPIILSSRVDGDTRYSAGIFADMFKEFFGPTRGLPKSTCIVSGGEMTARVSGPGKGGRNQDFCLALVPLIDNLKHVTVLSAGTDGIDGQTDAAGAVVDHTTHKRAKEMGLDVFKALDDYDSNSFLQQTDNLVVTGRTRTNVMDIQIVLTD
jgi:glycerate 2-kinase